MSFWEIPLGNEDPSFLGHGHASRLAISRMDTSWARLKTILTELLQPYLIDADELDRDSHIVLIV